MNKGLRNLVFGVGLVAVGAGISYSWTSTSLFDRLKTPTFEIAQRNKEIRPVFLEKIASEVDTPFLSGFNYDPDGVKKLRYEEELIKRETGKSIKLEVHPDGNYEVAVANTLSSLGKGRKSPVFVGRKLFESKVYGSFGNEEWKRVIVKLNRHAQIYHSGFEGVDKDLLVKKIESNEVSPQIIYSLGEIDAGVYTLRYGNGENGLSEKCRKDLRDGVSNNLVKVAMIYDSSSPFAKYLIDKVLKNNGIEMHRMYDKSRQQIPRGNTGKDRRLSL